MNITTRTKAIVPVHLFGQSADMAPIMALAEKHNLFVIEESQAMGSKRWRAQAPPTLKKVRWPFGAPRSSLQKPRLYGDGGALMTNDDSLAAKARMIANHGQSKMYYHDEIGVNSRLDAMQAVILNAKLKHLDEYNAARNRAADYYDRVFGKIPQLRIPAREPNSTHVFHQYTLQINTPDPVKTRDELKAYLLEKGVPAMIYYPVPLYDQPAFAKYWKGGKLPVTEALCASVFSLPMHSEMTEEILEKITGAVKAFFEREEHG